MDQVSCQYCFDSMVGPAEAMHTFINIDDLATQS